MADALKTKAANRRKSQRRTPRTSVKLECRKGCTGLGPNLVRVVFDFSETGACLVVSQELKLQSELEVLVSSYGVREVIKRIATVRWQVKIEDGAFCVGIEFQKRLDFRACQILAAPNG